MKTREQAGFTLLEMMLVIAIVSLLSLGGWSGWQRWQQRQQLDDSAQQIQQLLQRMRSNANWHNVLHLLKLTPGARWCLGTEQATCQGKTRHSLSAPYAGISVRELTDGMGFYGRNNVARPGRIIIVSEAGERRIIVSSRGRIRICQHSEESCR